MWNKRVPYKGAKQAADLLLEFGIEDPTQVDLADLAAAVHAYVDFKPISGSLGRLVTNDDSAMIVVDSNIREESKKRFVLAHELGHWLMHRNTSKLIYQCDPQDFVDFQNSRKEETEANVFASSLLLPPKLFESECVGKRFNLGLIEELADRFQTSLMATSLRFVDFGNHPVAMIFSQGGKIKWTHITKDFPSSETPLSFIRKKEDLPPGSVAHDVWKTHVVEAHPQEVDPSEWFHEDFQLDKWQNWRFYEQCFHLKSYDSIISFVFTK